MYAACSQPQSSSRKTHNCTSMPAARCILPCPRQFMPDAAVSQQAIATCQQEDMNAVVCLSCCFLPTACPDVQPSPPYMQYALQAARTALVCSALSTCRHGLTTASFVPSQLHLFHNMQPLPPTMPYKTHILTVMILVFPPAGTVSQWPALSKASCTCWLANCWPCTAPHTYMLPVTLLVFPPAGTVSQGPALSEASCTCWHTSRWPCTAPHTYMLPVTFPAVPPAGTVLQLPALFPVSCTCWPCTAPARWPKASHPAQP
jgi:hypothetical protein